MASEDMSKARVGHWVGPRAQSNLETTTMGLIDGICAQQHVTLDVARKDACTSYAHCGLLF